MTVSEASDLLQFISKSTLLLLLCYFSRLSGIRNHLVTNRHNIQMLLLLIVVLFYSIFHSADYNVYLHTSGVTRIGREDAPVPQDITIQGPGIEAEHCLIISEGSCHL